MSGLKGGHCWAWTREPVGEKLRVNEEHSHCSNVDSWTQKTRSVGPVSAVQLQSQWGATCEAKFPKLPGRHLDAVVFLLFLLLPGRVGLLPLCYLAAGDIRRVSGSWNGVPVGLPPPLIDILLLKWVGVFFLLLKYEWLRRLMTCLTLCGTRVLFWPVCKVTTDSANIDNV